MKLYIWMMYLFCVYICMMVLLKRKTDEICVD